MQFSLKGLLAVTIFCWLQAGALLPVFMSEQHACSVIAGFLG